MTEVAIVGRGAVGTTLAKALVDAGVPVVRIPGREGPKKPLAADLVVLAVPDARIAEVGARVAPWIGKGASVVHCAGARAPSELDALRARGLSIAAMHPMVSFADRKRPPSLEHTTFVLGGDAKAVGRAAWLARKVGARAVHAEVHGPSYHAAAALVANGTVGLAHAGVALLVTLGCGRKDAERAVAGLLHSVAQNVAEVGVPAALTGPIARGDADTVAAHRTALLRVAPRALRAYDGVARAVLACAEDAGLPEDRIAAIEAALARDPALPPPVTPPRPEDETRPRRGRARPRLRR